MERQVEPPYEDDVPVEMQATLGFVTSWLVATAIVVALRDPLLPLAIIVAIPVAGYVLRRLCNVMAGRLGWTAFPQGVMLGVLSVPGLILIVVAIRFAR